MTDQATTIVTEEAEAPTRFAKFKGAVSKINPAYAILTATAVVAGVALVAKALSEAAKFEVTEEIVIEVTPED